MVAYRKSGGGAGGGEYCLLFDCLLAGLPIYVSAPTKATEVANNLKHIG